MNLDRTAVSVLDHGFVRLVDAMGSDLSIVRAARVSYAAEWRSGVDSGSDMRLIQYLMRNKHTSPFESVVLTFEVKAPIFVLRQWHRHRTWSYNEVSARYSALPEEFYIPDLDQITTQSASNKQMRTDEQHPRANVFADELTAHSAECFRLYKVALEDGIPRELARCFLPLNTYSHMFATVDLHNLFHFLRLRLHEHAQYEIRVYAQVMLELARAVAPAAVGAFEDTL